MTPEQIAEIERKGTILKFEYGSRAHGTGTVDSDHDIMSIVIEPRETVIGLDEWDGGQHNTAGVGNRSGLGDTDQTVYSLRKWAGLAAKGNPTVQTALFIPYHEVKTELGQTILDNAGLFISREAGERYLGYMYGQRLAMTGQRNKRTNRPELVHKHGYDTKFAYHMIRLGMQGIELMESKRIQLPMDPTDALNLLDIRDGRYDKDYVLQWESSLEERLKRAIQISFLPEHTDRAKINKLLINIHEDFWTKGNW